MMTARSGLVMGVFSRSSGCGWPVAPQVRELRLQDSNLDRTAPKAVVLPLH
jgi:hypothetical protein